MNKRFKELAEQAGLEFDDDLVLEPEPIYYIKQKEFEKFAELIIRKCADIVNDLDEDHTLPGDCDTAVYIKQYFGVE